MFDLDKDCKGEIALANILVVESTNDPKYRSDSVFDVHARVLEGGDSNGMRVFTFDAKSVDYAEKWMRELCRATEILELKKSHRGVFSSSVSERMVQARNSRRMNMNTTSPVSISTPQQAPQASFKMQSDVDDESSSNYGSNDGTPTKSRGDSSPSQREVGGGGSGGRGGGMGRGVQKRGGMGRGRDFRGGSAAAAMLVRGGSYRVDSVGSSSLDVSAQQEQEQEPGTTYDDAYGDGGI